MTDPISPIRHGRAAMTASVPSDPGAFRALLSGDVQPSILAAAHRLAEGERALDRIVVEARRGVVHRPEELLALQATVYRYTQELELAAKLVDKGTTAVQRTLQSSG